jgi:aldose 1-epimerase
VFTLMGNDFAGGNTLVALEPQSSPANALNTGDGLVWLEPGQVWSGRWGVDIEEVSK